ncbi:MAG: crossover junction endodeoxyribonuclease RuvC [Candidatus Berkelbacteria bacterium]|nr:crossover junction endodeoxyribonuclease RuvC [Candidatus Berkelbacteria bacterium]
MKILGIDPGTGIMGWGLVEKTNSQVRALKYGCIRTKPNTPKMERFIHIYRTLCAIIEKEKPDQVAIEELFFFKNQKTIISVAEARGVALVCALKSDIPVFEYTPLQVKQALTGYGRAEKKQVQEMVKVVCHLDHCPKPDDAADALAIAICHAQTNQKLASEQVSK